MFTELRAPRPPASGIPAPDATALSRATAPAGIAYACPPMMGPGNSTPLLCVPAASRPGLTPRPSRLIKARIRPNQGKKPGNQTKSNQIKPLCRNSPVPGNRHVPPFRLYDLNLPSPPPTRRHRPSANPLFSANRPLQASPALCQLPAAGKIRSIKLNQTKSNHFDYPFNENRSGLGQSVANRQYDFITCS